MKASLDILRGELERLFSTTGLSELCSDYLGVDPAQAGLYDDSKAVFVRRLIDWAEKEQAIGALADAAMTVKKGMVDPRVKQIFSERFARSVETGIEVEGYRVGRELSSDSVGCAYLCDPLEGDVGRAVLYVVHGDHAMDKAAARRFTTMMRVLAATESKAVQPILGTGLLEDGRPYALLEPVDGRYLDNLVPLPAAEALRIFESVVEALDDLHSKGLLHADLRCENVIVIKGEEGARPEVKLRGLGADKLFPMYEMDAKAGFLSKLGVVKSMAPEVARGMGPEPASDVYGLGAMLFEALTGKPVFSGRSSADVIAAHLSKDVPSPSAMVEEAIPGALDNLVQKLMSKEASGRPRSLDEVRKILSEVNRAVEEAAARAAQTGTREDIETWADALLENPGDAEVLDELKNEAKRCNAWGAAIEVMEEAALLAEDEAIVRNLLLSAAQAATRYLKDYEKAEQMYSQLYESKPDDEILAEAMLDLLRAQGKFEELIEKLAAKAEVVEDPAERMGVIREIAEVYDNDLKESGKAFDYYVACLGGGADEGIVGRLEKLAEKTGRFEDLATSCGSAVQGVEAAGNQDLAVFYYRKLGGWYLERLDQATYALTCYQKVLEYSPSDTDALEAVADLYRGAQQWAELAQVMVRMGEVDTVPSRSRDRLADAAKVLYEKLSDKDEAKRILEGILEEDRAHGPAAQLLATIYENSEDWEKLTELLLGSVEAMEEGEDQVAARFRLGELYEDRLDDLKGAQEQYEKAIETDSRHLDAIKGLERIYARNGDYAKLKGNLETQLEIAVTPKQRITLLERLAEINDEEFRDLDAAIGCHREVLEIDGEHRAALVALTRYYRKLGRHEDLVDILERRAELSEDNEEKNELLSERAEIIRDDIGDAARAAEAFADLASIGGDSALDSLARSQVAAGDFESAVETLKKMIDAAANETQKIALLVRLAKVQLEDMEDANEAAATMRTARDIAPKDRSVMAELGKVYVAQGNYSAAIGVLEDELDLVEGSNARAEIYANMGVIALENIGDEDKAIGYFEHALELNKNNLTAGDNVSTLYRNRGQWDKAFPIYEIWAASSEALDQEKRLQLFTQMGEALVQMDRPDDAIKYFRKAGEVADEPPLIKRLGEVALEIGEHQLAKEQLERYQKAIGDGISAEEKIELFVSLGKAYLGTGDTNDAAKLARQATVMAPDHADARMLLADVHLERGDFRGAVEARQRVLDGMSKDDDRWLELVRQTAKVQFENLRDADGASRSLKEALESFPDDRDILGDLLKIYYATKRFSDVVDVILKIADLVDDAQQLARYYLTVAKIFRRELKKPDEAIEYFEKAVDKDPTLQDAEDALVEIHQENKNWEALEKHYKKQIARLPKDATVEEKLDLYVPMADLVITKMDRVKDGILLTEAISKLDPKNPEWLEKLTDLYGWGSDFAKKAIRTHRSLLEMNPARVDSFRMLYRIHSGEEEPDQAWCAASMLALLNQASPDERKYYRDYQPEDLPAMESRLKDEQWNKLLVHEDMNLNISSIFSVIDKAIFKAKAQDLEKFGLDPGKAIDTSSDSSDHSQFVNFAAGSLGVKAPPLHMHEGQAGGFSLMETAPPVLVAGKDAEKLKDRMGLAFGLGQQLALMRPGLFVNRLVSSGTELSAWLLASIKIFVQGLPVPGDLAGAVQERLSPIRESLDSNDLEKLQGYVQSFVSKAADVNLKRWARSINYTTDRAGLLLCGDVSVAVRILKEQVKDKAVLGERLKALTLFTVSEEHAKLREHLGIALKNG